MTPEEKAKEMIEHFAETIPGIKFGVLLERDWKTAKACALTCVEEILSEVARFENYKNDDRVSYWQQVKQFLKS